LSGQTLSRRTRAEARATSVMVNDTGLQKIQRCCAVKTLTPK
jgi:hypothetical protein